MTDPFGDYDVELLKASFPDLVLPFKNHFIVDLTVPPREFLPANHRRNVKKALRSVNVIECPEPASFGREWVALYSNLVRRHSIRGFPAFSESSLKRQLLVPGLRMFRAEMDGATVGIVLWMVQNGIAYYHLGAYNDDGYREGASFALFWTALHDFAAENVRWLSLGAGPGVRDSSAGGLSRFKRGWSTGTRPAYLCGIVLDPESYAQISRAKAISQSSYFPAYRKGEFD